MNNETTQKSWVRRHPVWTTLGALFVLGFMASAIDGTPKTSTDVTASSESEKKEEVITISPLALVSAYQANEISADSKYKRKSVQMKGVIDSLGKDVMDTAFVVLQGGTSVLDDVQCMFPKSQEESLMSLSKGDTITVQGEVSGKLGNVIVRNCSLIK